MVILNPLEPWPGELVLAAPPSATACGSSRRVVDYGGLFYDDVLARARVPASATTARFRPDGLGRGRPRAAGAACARSPSATA